MVNQVSIGRNPQSSIVVDAHYTGVSGNHATISRKANELVLEDHSTNGTYVNGQKVHHGSIAIHRGDRIMLGQQYNLDVDSLISKFCDSRETQRIVMTPATAREYPGVSSAQPHNASSSYRGTPNCLNKWSWGAFVFGWIWAVCHGIYWPLVTLVPYVGQVAALIICFVLGANGNRYAWEKFNGTAAEFDQKQKNWNVAAGICAIVITFIIVVSILVVTVIMQL